jgi:aminoglycoside phosphotransferase (APT) family kinase protein
LSPANRTEEHIVDQTGPVPAALPVRTSERPHWSHLPDAVRESAATALGSPVAEAAVQVSGFSSGLAVRAVLADGRRVFLKGVATDHPIHPVYAEEMLIARAMPANVPVPRLLDSWEAGKWLLMAFQDIDGRHPDLSPGSADTTTVLATLEALPALVTPSPLPDAPPVATALGDAMHGWASLAEQHAELEPWAARHLHRLAAAERTWVEHSGGNTLLHADLRPDNMLATSAGTCLIVDWAYPHQGAAWIDPAMLLPHFIRAGHTPAQAEDLAVGLGSWKDVDESALTSWAIALTGYWEHSSRLPSPPQVPYLRGYQAEMATVGRTWVEHRTGWH